MLKWESPRKPRTQRSPYPCVGLPDLYSRCLSWHSGPTIVGNASLANPTFASKNTSLHSSIHSTNTSWMHPLWQAPFWAIRVKQWRKKTRISILTTLCSTWGREAIGKINTEYVLRPSTWRKTKQGRGVGEKRGFNFRQGRSYKASQKTLRRWRKETRKHLRRLGLEGGKPKALRWGVCLEFWVTPRRPVCGKNRVRHA